MCIRYANAMRAEEVSRAVCKYYHSISALTTPTPRKPAASLPRHDEAARVAPALKQRRVHAFEKRIFLNTKPVADTPTDLAKRKTPDWRQNSDANLAF